MIFVSKDSDYLVSALDVSKLDLSNVNLCVLSTANSLYSYSTSCQDFGFLRGLKLAGAKSILGSLWNVDDMSTNLLMQRFYANLMNGMSKHESLFEAQRYLREYEIEEDVKQPSDNLTMFQRKQINKREKYVEQKTITRKIHPYAKPEYWAAFILLDAID
jgi:CHAT domain-containing protein